MSATVTSCSLTAREDDGSGAGSGAASTPSSVTTSDGSGKVVLVVHDSFALPDDLVASFEKANDIDLEIRQSGDAGELTNKLVLTQGDPIGDVSFGVDNAFASRALDADVFAPADVTLPAGAEAYELAGDDERALVPVDNGNVCVNVDDTYFTDKGIDPPQTFEDLTDPAYKGLFVTESAAASSPGLAFLLATIAEYGDDWPAYWERLMANDTRIASSWTDAYQVDFTQGGGNGDKPIVTSYDSSPAFTVAKGSDTSTTSALLDTCFLQVEYAGVLTGAANPEGAKKVLEWLVSPEVQAALPDSMYVFPVADGVALPEAWATFAQRPTDPKAVDPAEVADRRDEWLQEWTDITTR
ncbi:thiamine ABC transporter substrate-binding protein [Nocardioides rubriscoriae]|uniref:thiamine ABC transporter substrate-binding protein n=1 Tax=Nocardioides rubriscoriae TaxID=642762 RepID=UPI001FE58393|nr:thiamine ABC transporter substrate-binding protein [Nocardioides rubriscoriae]